MSSVKYKYVHGIECPICKEKIWSKTIHHFRYCFCKNCFIDGGGYYTRVGFETSIPRSVRIRVSVEEWNKYRRGV